jgi:ATP-dependent DNA helicase RecG
MGIEGFRKAQERGENIVIEFKESKGGITPDTYDTVSSFLNRFGGDIYLGVADDGTVVGIPEKSITGIIKNFINMVGNPEVINPTIYLDPEELVVDGKHIVHIHIPQSSEVHTHKKVVYDRVGDADVKVTATGQIAQMYLRKQKIFTEKQVFPNVTEADLRLDLLPRLRKLAVNRTPDHPWQNYNDSELLQSAGLYGEDIETGKRGLTLAAILLLGKDHVIKNACPTYRTDALLRKVNVDRYDDRLIVETNLIESYYLLMEFAAKHLWDKFYLEGDVRVSLRDKICREILANTLIHREFTALHYARFIIEEDRMYTENANRAINGEAITPQNYVANPKNPIIAAFFRNIGLADELGSGVQRLYKYGRLYSGQDPQMLDGDIFKSVVPLDDSYSYDAKTVKAQKLRFDCALNEHEIKVVEYLAVHPTATQLEISSAIGKSRRTVQDAFASLKTKGVIINSGTKQKPNWIVTGAE